MSSLGIVLCVCAALLCLHRALPGRVVTESGDTSRVRGRLRLFGNGDEPPARDRGERCRRVGAADRRSKRSFRGT